KPLGDVTTTMLWIGRQISAHQVILKLFIPSVFVCFVPLMIITFRFRSQFLHQDISKKLVDFNKKESILVLASGIALFLFVPIFKMITHLPPFAGMLLSLSILWILVSILHFSKPAERQTRLTVSHALQKIDSPSILFFLGILLAVSALESIGILKQLSSIIDTISGNIYQTGIALGLISSILDNVPLVAAAQGMYELTTYPTDHNFWEFIALTTGTGGSCIIIGSAAGVAAMGIEKIDFIWYLKKISWIALAGFISGILVFIGQTLLE
ncbi:MAG: sodium:proton antiporter, partial [Bacteroidetes bacterium]|nr:sodium:proton antiporter [Bacteroidota bacterium]